MSTAPSSSNTSAQSSTSVVALLERLRSLEREVTGASLVSVTAQAELARAAVSTAPVLAESEPSLDGVTREGLAALGARGPDERLALLLRIQRQCRPGAALSELTRDAILRGSSISISETSRPAPVSPSQRLALELWSLNEGAGHTLGEHAADLQSEALQTFVTRAFPTTIHELAPALTQVADAARDDAFIAFCERRPAPSTTAETFDEAAIDREVSLFEALAPWARLSCASAWLMRSPIPREVAESWIPLLEPGWSGPRDNAGRAIADARLSAVVASAGDSSSAAGLMHHANAGLDRENDPQRRAQIHRAILEATAIGSRQLDSPGAGAWFGAVDRVGQDRVTLRNRDAFFLARRAAIATLPRASLGHPDVANRGHELLRDLMRRLPERWLELSHLATVSALWRSHGRDPEIHLAALADLLRRDGLPSVDPRVDLSEVIDALARAAPSRLAPLGDRIEAPLGRAWWWCTAALSLCALAP